jgi:hypothetical protein
LDAPRALRAGPDWEASSEHTTECDECARLLSLENAFEDSLESLPAPIQVSGFVSTVMGRVREADRGPAEMAGTVKKAGVHTYWLWITTALGILLIAAGHVLGLVEEGLSTAMLARLSLNLGLGVFGGPSLASAAYLSQLVGLLVLCLGLLSLDPMRHAWEPAVTQRK